MGRWGERSREVKSQKSPSKRVRFRSLRLQNCLLPLSPFPFPLSPFPYSLITGETVLGLFAHAELLGFLIDFAFGEQRRSNDHFDLLHFFNALGAQRSHTGF